jgi:hypothetical protein
MEIAIINRIDVGLLLGFSFFHKDNEKDFNELNMYLFFIVIHIKWW